MVFKARKSLCVLVITAMLVFVSANVAYAEKSTAQPELPKHEIVKEKSDDSSSLDYISGDHYLYSLKIAGSEEALALACGYEKVKDGVAYPHYGFDPESFTIGWVVPDTLLCAKWGTVSQGSGRYIMMTTLLIDKYEGEWHIVFRDTREGYSRMSSCNAGGATFEIEYNDTGESLTIIFSSWRLDCWKRTQDNDAINLVASEWIGDDGETWLGHEEHRVMRYPFVIEDRIAKIGTGKEYIYLPKKDIPLQHIADYLGLSTESIMTMNPQLIQNSVCSDEILIRENIPPYEPDASHYYGGGL